MSHGEARYRIEYTRAALADLRSLPKKILGQINEKLDLLRVDPRCEGTRKLTDEVDKYRIRSGDYRVLYVIEEPTRVVTVARVMHRKDAYRK